MSIQRTSYQIQTQEHASQDESLVQLLVFCEGKIEDRGDALLMILDAWADAMTEAGFDPDKSFRLFRNSGRLN